MFVPLAYTIVRDAPPIAIRLTEQACKIALFDRILCERFPSEPYITKALAL